MESRLLAFIVSIVIVLEGFIVLLFVALMRTETPSFKRFAGLGLGLAGIATILLFGMPVDTNAKWVWLGIALLIEAEAQRRPRRGARLRGRGC